ncbi:hypothetical protein [Streptomyces radiopugnans]|uniref:Uncharacterized protein n=1 Tax=Streptomyces radiopugnans TaxID=403935 RepID=A0A1H8ZKX0_9ACTN|nr:hypothetical protein [Streptomyces radiopugnans]SEP65004.1 hypothetical protein SAMN05216481_101592 [Streptomyces radiopugnans]
MGLFRRTTSARSAYTTEPTTDPETGRPAIGLRSGMTGGHIVSLHATRAEAEQAADRLAAQWDTLRRN